MLIWICSSAVLASYILRWVDYGALTSVINAVQVFTKTIRAQSISNFADCQPSIMGWNVATKAPAGPLMSLCSTVRHRCWEVTAKRGRATTLHTLIGINTKFGDGTFSGPPGIGVINHEKRLFIVAPVPRVVAADVGGTLSDVKTTCLLMSFHNVSVRSVAFHFDVTVMTRPSRPVTKFGAQKNSVRHMKESTATLWSLTILVCCPDKADPARQ